MQLASYKKHLSPMRVVLLGIVWMCLAYFFIPDEDWKHMRTGFYTWEQVFGIEQTKTFPYIKLVPLIYPIAK
jgi:hypothetical protein